MIRVVWVLMIIALLIACGKPVVVHQGQDYIMESVYPEADNRFRAYSTLLLSFYGRKWNVTHLDFKENRFKAKYCAGGCLAVDGKVSEGGQVTFQIVVQETNERTTMKLISSLQRTYKKYSGLSTELLIDKADNIVYWDLIKDLKK